MLDWEELENSCRSCTACPLCQRRTNVVFGVGAFCFHALFSPNNKFTVITRDTWGMAMKATYGEFGGKSVPIYKDPKTDGNGLKKSHKGCCRIVGDGKKFKCIDGLTKWASDHETSLHTVFLDGRYTNINIFQDIRTRLYPEVLDSWE